MFNLLVMEIFGLLRCLVVKDLDLSFLITACQYQLNPYMIQVMYVLFRARQINFNKVDWSMNGRKSNILRSFFILRLFPRSASNIDVFF